MTASVDACHIRVVTLFNFSIQRGSPIIEQVVFASIRAILRGEYPPGQAFPSFRAVVDRLIVNARSNDAALADVIDEISTRWRQFMAG